MRVRWTVPADGDLDNIKAYLDANYPQFAEPTVGPSTSGSVP
jgi:hypothetical protein